MSSILSVVGMGIDWLVVSCVWALTGLYIREPRGARRRTASSCTYKTVRVKVIRDWEFLAQQLLIDTIPIFLLNLQSAHTQRLSHCER